MNKNEFKKAKDTRDIAIELIKKTPYWMILVFVLIFPLVHILNIIPIIDLITISLFLIFCYIIYIYNKAQKIFMEQFAKDNGLNYQKTAPIETVHGKLFEVGHSRSINNVISGIYKDHPMRIFNYTFVTGHGRHSRSHGFTVLELSFEKVDFPHILLLSQTMGYYRGIRGKSESISLEDEFRKDFELFVQKGYEIEAMQIFTLETLRTIKEKVAKFSIGFYDKTVYFFDDKTIGKNIDLQELLGVTEKVFESMRPLLNRLYNDFEVLHKYYRDRT